ncbi:MAG: hypothetical protein WKG00_07015 [Polyangiaceae bacterium]
MGGTRGRKWLLVALALALATYALRAVPQVLWAPLSSDPPVLSYGTMLALAWSGALWAFLYPWLLGATLFALPAIAAVRALLRMRFYRDGVDLTARLRQLAMHRRRAGLLGAAASALAVYLLVMQSVDWRPFAEVGGAPSPLPFWIGAGVLFTSAGLLLLRACWSLLTANLLYASPRETTTADSDGLVFGAVAVTRESRLGIVALVAMACIGGFVAATSELGNIQFRSTEMIAAVVLYVAAAAATIAQFQRSSRITLGLDGILIHGTSRRRFFGYHDLDTAESTRWGEILLRRGDTVVLRLQPHGEDAARREPLAARIQAAIDHSRALATSKARRLAETASGATLRGVARGGDGYRATGVGRDELWQLIEAPVASSEHRRAAAEALAASMTGNERRRLRVAAEHCADPAARDVLLRIASSDGDGDADAAAEAAAIAEEAAHRRVPLPALASTRDPEAPDQR